MRRILVLCSCLAMLGAAKSRADSGEQGAFVVTLGVDTTSVERYTRTKDRLEVDQVGRTPRVLRRKFAFELRDGIPQKLSMVVTPPGVETPTQTIEVVRDGDSLRLVTHTGNNPEAKSALALPANGLFVAGSSPFTMFEGEVQKLMRSKSDTLGAQVYYLGAGNLERYRVKKLGRDSVEIWTSRGDLWRAKVDKAGHLLGMRPIAGTFQVTLARVTALDMDGLATAYRAREQGGASLGVLSPRDTVRAALAGGGSLMIDYGKPAKRGRVVYGGLVPYGQVWRTGANAATQLFIDRPIEIAGHALAAGGYTLWTIPGADGWKFIVNSETGQWGTAHSAEKDLFTVDMKTSTLPHAEERFTISLEPTSTGGFIHLDWDTTRASIEYVVKPGTEAAATTK